MNARKSALTLLIAVLVFSCARPPAAPADPDRRVRYSYDRPSALGTPPQELALAVPAVPAEQLVAEGERKATRLAAALGVSLDAAKRQRKIDAAGEILRLSDGRHRFKVYVPSGMVKYRDTQRYNRLGDDDASASVLRGADAIARARDVLSKLADAGLVRKDELLFDAARVYHRKEQNGRGAREGEKDRPRLAPAVAVDTRVFVPRVLDGIPVSGHGVRVVLTNRGELAGLDLLWRDVGVDGNRRPVTLSLEQAKRKFEQSLRAPQNAMVDVSVAELVYMDPGLRHPAAFLEPAFLFVYQVRTPTGERDEFRMSKLLHLAVPATAHGRTQMASPRDLRHVELARRLDRARPAKIELPTQQKEDED